MLRWLRWFSEARVSLPCPMCGYYGEIVLERRSTAEVTYTVDCLACGQPSRVHLDTTMDAGGGARISIEPLHVA